MLNFYFCPLCVISWYSFKDNISVLTWSPVKRGARCQTSVILALGRMRQEDCLIQNAIDYIVRCSLKKPKRQLKQTTVSRPSSPDLASSWKGPVYLGETGDIPVYLSSLAAKSNFTLNWTYCEKFSGPVLLMISCHVLWKIQFPAA